MCLKTLDFTLDENGEGVGYKVFDSSNGRIKGLYHHTRFLKTEWNHDKNNKMIGIRKYISGYHIYLNVNDAISKLNVQNLWGYKNRKLFKVKFKNVVAYGTDNPEHSKVVVAKSFKIIEEITC